VPDFKLEAQHSGNVIGIDEVGRGPWAGPVIAAAVMLDPLLVPASLLQQINDSKKLTKAKRERISFELKAYQNKGCHFAIGQASVEEIDALNIRQATFLAMQRAVENLPFTPDVALVDGNACPKFSFKAISVIKGDSVSASIAAASIIAKVFRDLLMADLADHHIHYGWERNSGYGTREHQEALSLHGLTPHHRKSFAPIRQLLAATA
jgi:ribonuclease HII